jgi:hypothetical protein
MAFPTIERPVIVFMTLTTEAHCQWFSLPGYSLFLDVTVTEGAYLINAFDRHAVIVEDETSQVLFMGKMYEVRYVMYLFPPRWFVLFPVFGQLFDPRFIRCDDTVATHTLTGRRNTCDLAASRIGVTVHAVDLVDLGMDVMRKFDWLLYVFPVVCPLGRNCVGDYGRGSRGK